MHSADEFSAVIAATGITPPEVIEADGRLHRFSSNGKPRDDSGWYVLHDDGTPAGSFGDWRTGLTQTWCAASDHKLTREEKAAFRRKVAEMQKARAEDTAKRHTEARERAAQIWAETVPCAEHPYLSRKHIAPHCVRLHGSALVVPMRDADGILHSLQFIADDGTKKFLTGGRVAGCYCAMGSLKGAAALCIAEGFATGASIHEATDLPVAVAFNAGGLLAVAQALREKFPALPIVLCADDDYRTDGNPGMTKATEAARIVGGVVAVPDFGDDRPEGATDFNDLRQARGADAVRQCIDAAMQVPHLSREDDTQDADSAEPHAPDSSAAPAPECRRYAGGRFEVSERGVFFIDDDEKAPMWICSPLHVVAKTRDTKGCEWGRLLEWHDDDGTAHQWAMPLELLQGDGLDVRRELTRQGLVVGASRKVRELLSVYLQVWSVEKRARCVDRLGWRDGVYVTPAESIGEDDERVVFQNAQAIEPALSCSGIVEDWRDGVAALAAGNSRLVFALSIAFAAPLAELVGEDSGGFHLRGSSSSGKTTALKVAASVWGHPDRYPRLWRATTNGLEGLAALHNDGLLILDEISQIDPRQAGEAAYMLANGQGKARANRNGAARAPMQWRLLFLSSGEESLPALMSRVGSRTNAGQEIRLADIEADAGAGMGAVETLHGLPSSAALVQAIKDAASCHHGTVGVTWLHTIVGDRLKLVDLVADAIRQFVGEVCPKDAAGQVLRVARRFGLVAAAGELASIRGLTGWQEGEAISAAGKCFAAWLDAFGGAGNREERAMLAQARAFFGAHGASRFEDVLAGNDQRVINRAGFYRTNAAGEREFLVLPEAFRREICQGFDAKAMAAALLKAGWIQPDPNGKTSKKERLPGLGSTRCYVFTARMWEES